MLLNWSSLKPQNKLYAHTFEYGHEMYHVLLRRKEKRSIHLARMTFSTIAVSLCRGCFGGGEWPRIPSMVTSRVFLNIAALLLFTASTLWWRKYKRGLPSEAFSDFQPGRILIIKTWPRHSDRQISPMWFLQVPFLRKSAGCLL